MCEHADLSVCVCVCVCVCVQARKRALIEDERKALLREAAELIDYLPRGVLRDQADLQFVQEHLARANIN